VITPNDVNYLRRLYTFNRDTIQDYYLSRNFAVKNTHILSRILVHFPSFLNYDTYRYLDFTNDRTKYLAKHFKFTSDIEKGLVHPSYFFGNSGEEIIVSSYQNFDVMDAERNWKTSKPITILTQPRNDLKLLMPLGTDDGSRSGLDVLMINIPMLAIKYREFVKEQSVRETTEEGMILSKNHFVIKYVLPTMMEDLIDHMFLNKMMDKFYGREEVTPKFKHRFKIFEPDLQVQRYVDNTLDVITSKNLDFVNMMRNIQLMFKKDASELLAMDELGATRQVKWSILVSRLDTMIFLYDAAKTKGGMNNHYLNDWKRLVKRMDRDTGMMDMFSYETSQVIKEKFYKISQM
jgi:hypothetical protein